jgi:arylsulfatase A-like enzyme
VGGVYDKMWDVALPESFYKVDPAARNWSQRSYAAFCDMVYGQIDPTNEALWRRYQSYYFNCIRDVDRNVGTVLDHLKSTGQANNTIVVYVSDHGEMAGAQQLRQKGPHMFKENMRVPLIISHPDVRGGGTTTDALASPVDMIPTLLGFAGVQDAARETHYPTLKGVDVGSVVADGRARTRRDARGILYNYGISHYWDPVYVEKAIEKQSLPDRLFLVRQIINTGMYFPSLDNRGLFRGVYDGRYKFARYFSPAQHHTPRDFETLIKYNDLELYDTARDPNELVNLARTPGAARDELLRLSALTNALVAEEVGIDDGREHMGPKNWYRLNNKLPGSPA